MMRQHHWARRNVWGVLALIPVAAALLTVYSERSGSEVQLAPPAVIAAGPDGWASYHGAQIRLIELSPAKDIRDTSGGYLKLPEGIIAWRAVLEYDVTDQKLLTQCELSLEDSKGRLFQPRPLELATARIPATGCTAEDQTLYRYQAFVFFVTPAGAEPVAVRLAQGPHDYARLTLR